MTKIRILIVEDEMVVADHLETLLTQIGYDALPPVINYTEAVAAIEETSPDLALLDIQLAGSKDGIDLAWKIREDYHFPFIFLTSNADPRTVNRAKPLNPPAYLVKPFQRDDLYTAIELALHNYSRNTPHKEVETKETKDEIFFKDALFLKNKNLFEKVLFTDIVLLKAEHVYVEVHTVSGKKYLVRNSLTSFTTRLPEFFFRTHRSYSINLNHLSAINSAYILLQGHKVPIGKNYREDLMKRIRVE